MAVSYTPRMGFPEMADGEASGYVTFNDLGRFLDTYVQTVVQSRTVTDPPGSPVDGQIWSVPTGATGVWVGHEGEVAQWYNGQWYYYPVSAGMTAWVLDEELLWTDQRPAVHAVMGLAGAEVTGLVLTTTPTAFQIADESLVAPGAPAPSTVDLATSRITLNDYLADAPLQVNASASLIGTGNGVQYIMAIYKNGVIIDYLRCLAEVSNQSSSVVLSIPGGITSGKSGDYFDVRFLVDTGTATVEASSFSFSLLPVY